MAAHPNKTALFMRFKNDLKIICHCIKEQPELANRRHLNDVIMASNRTVAYIERHYWTPEHQEIIDKIIIYTNIIRAFCLQESM